MAPAPAAARKPDSVCDPERYRPVHIAFVGAGAVGCFYASRLHHPTHNIHTSLIARSNYPTLAAHGVTLQTHSFGDYTFHPEAVYPSVPAAAAAPVPEWDYVIVTTKALPDRSDDAALVAPLVTDGRTCLVLIQNGVGVEAPYRARFPKNPIVSAVTVVSAEQVSHGVVRQNRWTRVSLGGYVESASTVSGGGGGGGEELGRRGAACAAQLADWWGRLGGIRDVEVKDEIDLQMVRWHKLCINAAFNPSAVLSGGRGNADMVRDAELRAHLKGVMEEIWEAVPRVLGRGFGEGMASPERILKSTERNVGSKPSMLLDWEAGRPMEVEVILGNPVRIARGKGVELPRMQSLYALLRSMQEMRERGREGKL